MTKRNPASVRMFANCCDHGLQIGTVRIICCASDTRNYWLSISDKHGETHKIRITKGGKVFVYPHARTPRRKRGGRGRG